MQSYIKIRGHYATDDEQFFVFHDRSVVRPSNLRMTVCMALQNLGLNDKLYLFHSLRIGCASQLIKLGFPIDMVKRIGRWKSNTIYHYIKS